jgi:hypothetical protein
MSDQLVEECAQDDECGHCERRGLDKRDQLELIGDLLLHEPAVITGGFLFVPTVGGQVAGPFAYFDLYGSRLIFAARVAERLGSTGNPIAGQAYGKMPGGVRGAHGLRRDSYGGKQVKKITLRLVPLRSVLQYPFSGFLITTLLDDSLPEPFLLA